MLQIVPCIELLQLADGAGVSSHHWNCVQEEEHLVLYLSDLDFNSSQLGKKGLKPSVLTPALVPVEGAEPVPVTPFTQTIFLGEKGIFSMPPVLAWPGLAEGGFSPCSGSFCAPHPVPAATCTGVFSIHHPRVFRAAQCLGISLL